MALDVYVTSFNITTGAAASTVVITPNFQTKAGILFWSGRTSSTDGNGAGTHLRGHGFFSSTSAFSAIASRSADAGGNAVADSSHRADACIVQTGDGADVGWADVSAISSTQVTFRVVDQFTVDLRVTVICFGGSEITSVQQGVFTAAGVAPVDQTVSTGGSETPRLIFLMDAFINSDAPAVAVDSKNSFGVIDATTGEEWCWSGGSNDGSANMITESYLREGDCIAQFSGNFSAINNRATFVSASAPGGAGQFVINWASRASDPRIFFLTLCGTFSLKVGSFLTQTDTTTDMTGSTTFTPKGMVFVSHNKSQNSAGGLSAHDKWSMGVATGTGAQHCQAVADRDANTNAFVSFALEQDHIYVNMDEVNQTLQGSANLTAVSSSGFTARMTDADPAQASVCWLALGNAPTKARPPFRLTPQFFQRKRVQ